jgi:putative membrane fusion protein
MADTDKRRAVTTRIIWGVIGVFFLITVVSQAMILFGSSVRTEVATLYTATDSIGFKGVYARDEKLVSYNANGGIVSYTHTDGSKIGKTAVIAQIYRNRSDIALRQQIDDLQAQRDVLVDAQNLVGADTSQLESFSSQIGEKHSQLMKYIYEGDYKSASALKSDILNLQSKREIVKGTETSYEDKIRAIDNEIMSLRSKITSEPYEIRITETGYFISKVDGYEEQLNSSTVFDLTAEDIERITSAEPRQENPSGVIGKLVSDYTWYMAAVLDTIRLGTVFEGAQVTLRIGSSSQNIKADIVSLKRLDDGRSIAVFKCDMFLADFIDSRTAQARLLLEDYQGINIPNSALRMREEDGAVGVYIQDGIIAKFRKVKQILSREDYTLVADTTDEEGYLSLYDNIIVEGRDLHEGKIIG